MTSRQAGRRIGTIAAEHRTGNRKKRGGARQAVRRKSEPLSPKDRRRLAQLVACGAIFVLLVAVKLLLPGKMDALNTRLSGMLRQNMDVQAVFSAVGEAVTGQQDVGGSLRDVYQAVFQPQEGEAVETAASAGPALSLEAPTALEALTAFRSPNETAESGTETAAEGENTGTAAQETAESGSAGEVEVSTLAYILYSANNLPDNVNLEQALLGFDYCTPVMGTLSSGFGYREHPVEGEERFHYGIDIAASTGTPIGCFADGTVTAVGDSSSYGKYLIVAHSGGFSTLYAHCSKIIASSGQTVKEGQTIAEVGETGVATGPHLHLELHQGDRYLNPIYYVSLA
jgi:murein DD-endopeptidase MepM/ murein hydrolase activator NlpD